ncbi:hypothetical protein GOODEAATRI_032202 [Goodea atripinnis]|uniref:Uncharacterized protein n=1 Tax=Goodea atripinnis TaxID=208336 RepID=A0ABV0Q2T8_9TELE
MFSFHSSSSSSFISSTTNFLNWLSSIFPPLFSVSLTCSLLSQISAFFLSASFHLIPFSSSMMGTFTPWCEGGGTHSHFSLFSTQHRGKQVEYLKFLKYFNGLLYCCKHQSCYCKTIECVINSWKKTSLILLNLT